MARSRATDGAVERLEVSVHAVPTDAPEGTLAPTGGAVAPDPAVPDDSLTARDEVLGRYRVGDTVECAAAGGAR